MKDYFFNSIWLVIAKGISFIIILIFQRYLPEGQYSSFILVYSLIIGIQSFAVTGLMSLLDRINAENSEQINTDFSELMRTSLTLSVIIGLAFVIVARLSIINGILGVIVGVITVYSSIKGYGYRIRDEVNISYKLSYIFPALSLFMAGTMYFLIQNVSLFLLTWGALLFLLLLCSGNITYVRWRYEKSLFLMSLPFALISLVSWLTGFGINYFLSINNASDKLNYFSVSFAFAGIVQLLVNSLRIVWLPKFLSSSTKIMFNEQRKNNFLFHRNQVILQFILSIIFVSGLNILNKFLNWFDEKELSVYITYTGFILGAYLFQSSWNYIVTNCFKELKIFRYTLSSSIVAIFAFALFVILYFKNIEIYYVYAIVFSLKTWLFGILVERKDKYFYRHYFLTISFIIAFIVHINYVL